MKTGLLKRILATGMLAVLLAGEVLPVGAETVSGGDIAAPEESAPTMNAQTALTVSGGDLKLPLVSEGEPESSSVSEGEPEQDTVSGCDTDVAENRMLGASVTERTVTFEHYLGTPDQRMELYAPFELKVPLQTTDITKLPLQGTESYELVDVIVQNGTLTGDLHADNLRIGLEERDATVELYYAEIRQPFLSDVTFFDYDVTSVQEGGKKNSVNTGINEAGKYAEDGSFLAMSVTGDYHTYPLWMNKYGEILDANFNQSYKKQSGKYAIFQGLITGLTGEQYETVVTGYNAYGKKIVEPGYFSGEAVSGKRIFDTRYDLKFVQEGNTYTLFSALDLENGQQETRALELDFQEVTYHKDLLQNVSTSFFPLDALADCEKNHAGHNEYYGMRFDFEFSLGNYVGPMTFRFVGDDDLWVFVDGNPVLDLGGIHSAYPKEYNETPESNEVDLWSKVFAINTAEDNWYTSEAYRQLDKTEKHQVTVLYMERGGVDAACFMQFVMPDVTCIESVIQKPALLELTKVDSKTGEALGGAVFRLTKYTDDACQTVDTNFGVNGSTEVVSGDKGKLRFENLGEGYYQLMETKAPEGYYLSTDKWKLVASMEEDGTVRIDAEGLTDGRIANVPLELVLDSSKSASLVDWEKRIYQVNLAAFAEEKTISTTKDANVLLLVDASGSMIFTDALISAQQLDPGKIYFTKPFVSTENNTYGKAWRVSSKVRKRLLETAFSGGSCYGIPSTGEYLFYVEDGEQSGWYKKDIRYLGNRAWWERDESLTLTNAVKTDPAQLSLYTNRSELFVDAAVQFVNGLSENSKVAVVTFGNEGAASKKTDFVSLQSGREQVLHAIRQAVGVYWTGTYAGNGFSQAADMFEKLGDYEDSYMVFFTDGEIDDPNQTRRASAALKEDGVKIYAIGVGEGNSDILYDVATSKAYVKTCDNMTDVANALTSLGLSAPGTVENVQMVDEISECFELCDQEGLPVTSLEGAEISYREGRQVITWNRQTLAIGGEGLHKTIYIRAKDCFAGGNFIPTNGQFVVTFPDGKTTEQPTPYVNVRTSVRAGNAEDTIFLGESLQSYFTTEQETAVSGVTYDAHGKVIALAGENGAEYTNLDYVHVSVSWKDEKGNAVTREEIRSKAPTEETNFFATVTVSPKFAPDSPEAQTAAESMQANPDEVLHVVETMQAEPDGIYTVKVLNGQITVTKKIKKAEIDYKDGDPIFTFRVEKDGRTQTRMVRFAKETVKSLTPDADGYISLQVRFDNLSKGVYRVEELSTLGYQPESANVDRENTSCAFAETKDGIRFAIGQQSMEDATMKPEAVQGACCYVNKAQNTNREMDKDMVVNQVVMENGRVIIQPRTIPEQN